MTCFQSRSRLKFTCIRSTLGLLCGAATCMNGDQYRGTSDGRVEPMNHDANPSIYKGTVYGATIGAI